MNAIRISSVSLSIGLLACSGANAQYRCAEPSTDLDRRACAAAKQGPEALRRFIQRVRVVEPLHFNDYVDRATLIAWEEKAAREQAARPAATSVATREGR
jgi:hypothetical protein